MTQSESTIRLLLVDDHPLVLDGINARLEEEDGILVVGQACNGKETRCGSNGCHHACNGWA